MSMTLKLLRSRCMMETGDHNPGPFMPNPNVAVREGVAEIVRKIGGLRLSTSFDTVIGQREYTTADGFPSGAIGIYKVTATSTRSRVSPIARHQRSEDPTTGTPCGYYMYSRSSIGFDAVPNQVIPIYIDYLGLGTAASSDDDIVLSAIPTHDDDTFWNAVKFHYAHVYYRSRYAHHRDPGDRELRDYYKREASLARYQIMSEVNNMNQDEGLEVMLDEDFFRGQYPSYYERFANEGDLLTII